MKTFAVAPLTGAPSGELRVVHSGLRVTGARKPSEVARAMAAHFDAFRACAQGSAPPEPGRVQLDFDIAPDGRTSPTSAGTGALQQCLDQSLSRVTFAPGAGDSAHVVYPLYFATANSALHSPPAAPPPAPCDCGG